MLFKTIMSVFKRNKNVKNKLDSLSEKKTKPVQAVQALKTVSSFSAVKKDRVLLLDLQHVNSKSRLHGGKDAFKVKCKDVVKVYAFTAMAAEFQDESNGDYSEDIAIGDAKISIEGDKVFAEISLHEPYLYLPKGPGSFKPVYKPWGFFSLHDDYYSKSSEPQEILVDFIYAVL
jgi:hypothetical protein